MQKNHGAWQVAGFIFTSILGTFLHFLFDLTGENLVAGMFSAVNESIWEHMKLIFYPMVLFAIIEWNYIGRKTPGYWCIKLTGLLLALIMIPVIYYTYTGILGTSADWFNIAIFFIAAGAAYWTQYKMLTNDVKCPLGSAESVVIMIIIFALFTFFTFNPPHIPLFKDPISGKYGFFQINYCLAK